MSTTITRPHRIGHDRQRRTYHCRVHGCDQQAYAKQPPDCPVHGITMTDKDSR